MNLLILAPELYGGHGGIAKYCRDFVRAASSYEKGSRILALARKGPLEPTLPPPGTTVVSDGIASSRQLASALVRKLIRPPDLDLIVCAHLDYLPLGVLASIRCRRPLVLLIYGVEAWSEKSRLSIPLLRYVSRVVSISEITRDRFLAWSNFPSGEVHIVPNCIDTSEVVSEPLDKPRYLVDRYALQGRKVILSVGRIPGRDRHKGYDEVLEMLPKLLQEEPSATYLIAGDGPDRPRLQEKARSLGVADFVTFCGHIPEHEKRDHYLVADAFVMPSRGEGFGFVFLEALAAGLPVVGSTADGSREALRGGALGAVVDPDDSGALLTATLHALSQSRDRPPEGLSYFFFSEFEKRVHAALGTTSSKPGT